VKREAVRPVLSSGVLTGLRIVLIWVFVTLDREYEQVCPVCGVHSLESKSIMHLGLLRLQFAQWLPQCCAHLEVHPLPGCRGHIAKVVFGSLPLSR